ncbi:hypothetical protein J6590_023197 [Homalodisca vitripennis]|nr:hypothetical protein J6590_023197 [Homalodisca vitripennis]
MGCAFASGHSFLVIPAPKLCFNLTPCDYVCSLLLPRRYLVLTALLYGYELNYVIGQAAKLVVMAGPTLIEIFTFTKKLVSMRDGEITNTEVRQATGEDDDC